MSQDNVQILLYIVAGVSVILFLVAVIMSYKSWKIHTLMMVFLVFCATCALLWMSAQTLKMHESWRQIIHGPPGAPEMGLMSQTKVNAKINQELEFGRENDEGEIVVDGIAQLKNKLAGDIYVRGRMWIDCKKSAMASDADSVTVVVQEPIAYNKGENSHILYLFENRPVSEGGNYLGVFRLTNVTGGAAADGEGQAAPAATPITVTMSPAWDMSDEERARLVKSANDAKHTWILYNKMPVDGHQVFDGLSAKDLGITAVEFVKLDRRAFERIIPPESAQEFAKDHQDAEANDPASRIEILVEFKSDYPDSDIDDEEADTVQAKFHKDQIAWIPKEAAPEDPDVLTLPSIDELVEQEIVEIVEGKGNGPRYVRKLRDYGRLLGDQYLYRASQQAQNDLLDAQIAATKADLERKRAISTSFKEEGIRLSSDLERFENEREVLDGLLKAVRRQTTNSENRMNALRAKTIELAEKLDAAQMKAVEIINRRTPPPPQTGAVLPVPLDPATSQSRR